MIHEVPKTWKLIEVSDNFRIYERENLFSLTINAQKPEDGMYFVSKQSAKDYAQKLKTSWRKKAHACRN